MNSADKKKIQFLAYYLPQYHPIAENDAWWGKGFTEWTNVAKATPKFKGHHQPKLPADFGFYDLRVPKIQEEQSELALRNGITGFIYYQYWFGKGKLLLQGPAEQMLSNSKIQIPFCFCWANETWKGIWHGLQNPNVLIEQKYDGVEAYTSYFNYLLPFFKDERYIKVDGRPMFHIYKIEDIPDYKLFVETFDALAVENGFTGIHTIATIVLDKNDVMSHPKVYGEVGLDIFREMRYGQNTYFNEDSPLFYRLENFVRRKLGFNKFRPEERSKPIVYDYKEGVSKLNSSFPHKKYIPCVFPNWDNSPRSGNKSLIFKNATPTLWQKHLKKAVNLRLENPDNPPFIIIKSWNEWAEGNYLEPDTRYGHQWVEAVRVCKDELLSKSK